MNHPAKNLFLILFLVLFSACTKIKYEPTGAEWSFVVIGDVRQGYGIYSQLVHHIVQQEPLPEIAFCMGDIMLRPGNEVEWESFWHKSKPLTDRMPLHIIRGNHEGNDPASEWVFSNQTGLHGGRFYYTIRLRHTAFIILDTDIRGEEGSIGQVQLSWLEEELDMFTSDTAVESIFIFMHRPIFPQGEHKGNDFENAGELHRLFLSHPKTRAVFAGHDHIYNSYVKDGMNYITTCGGGEPLIHGYGGDYYHFLMVSFHSQEKNINIKTIGLFNETIEDYDL